MPVSPRIRKRGEPRMAALILTLALLTFGQACLAAGDLLAVGDMEEFGDLSSPRPVWNRMGEPCQSDKWQTSTDNPSGGKACITTDSTQEFILGAECGYGQLTGRAMVRATTPDTRVRIRLSWYDRLNRMDATETVAAGTGWQPIEVSAKSALAGACELAISAENGGARVWVDDMALLADSGPADPMAGEPLIEPGRIDLLTLQAYEGDRGSLEGAVSLRVDLPEGARPATPLVSGGIPFPKGALYSPGNVRITLNGAEIPCQVDVLSRWHGDSSIQSLLVSFPARYAEQTPGDGAGFVLEYGPQIRRPRLETSVLIKPAAGGYEVSTSRLSFALTEDVAGPSGVQLDGKRIVDNARTVLAGLDGAEIQTQLAGPCEVRVERSGPLFATLLVRAKHGADDANAGFATDLRITVFADAPTRLLMQHSLTNLSQNATQVIGAAGYRFDAAGEFSSPRKVTALQRDGAEPQSAGCVSAELAGSQFGISVRDFTEHYPMGLELSGPQATVWTWPPDGAPAVCLSQGISQTREFVVDFAGEPPPWHTRTMPLLTADAEWYCSTGVFNFLLPPDADTFPIFEARIGSLATLGRFSWDGKQSGKLFGAFNYGDAPGDGGWSNIETMAAHELFLHHFRTLSREHYEAARLAAEHYRDVDVHHGLGFCHVHCSNHTASEESWSHSWIQGIRDLFFLTGDGRCLDVLNEVGTRLLSKEPGFATGRDWTRPIDNLVDIYSATGDPRYLQSALENIAVLRDRQVPEHSICGAEKGSWYEDRYSAGSAFTWYGCLAMAKLHQNVGGDDLKQTFLRELDLSLDVATKAIRSYNAYPDEQLPEMKCAEEIGIFALGRGSVVFPPIGYAYRITGDRKYLDLGMKVLAFCLMNQRGGSDASATSFMTAFLREAKQAGLGPAEEAAAFQAARDFAWGQWPGTLQNGDLELGSFRGWDIKKVPGQSFFYDDLVKVGWYVDDKVSHKGRHSLRFHSDNYSRFMSAGCTCALPPSRRFKVSVWVKADDSMNPAASFQVKEYDTDQSTGVLLRPTGRVENGFEEREAHFTTAGRAVGSIAVSHSNGTGDCWFDSAAVEDLGPTYALLTKAVGGTYSGEPKIDGGDVGLESPIPFEKGSLTDGIADYIYQNVPQATYSYWQLPEAELTMTLNEVCRVRRIAFHMLQHGKARSHGTALARVLDGRTGDVLGTLEPPADGWNEIDNLDVLTDTIRVQFKRREGDTYITLSEFEIRGERVTQPTDR